MFKTLGHLPYIIRSEAWSMLKLLVEMESPDQTPWKITEVQSDLGILYV